MEKNRTYIHSNISKVKSYCRNRRLQNKTSFTEHQQEVYELIDAKTKEFQNKILALQQKLRAVKGHVNQTKNRLNTMHDTLN